MITPQQVRQSLLAFELGQHAQVQTIQVEQIEHHHPQMRALHSLAEQLLQLGEAAAAAGFQGDQLTVQNAAATGKLAHRSLRGGELQCPILLAT